MTDTCDLPEWLRAVQHFSTADYLSNPRPDLGEEITIYADIPASAPLRQVILRTVPNGEQSFTALQPEDQVGDLTRWSAQVPVNEKHFHYRFGLVTEDNILWLNALGISEPNPLDLFDFKLLADTPEIPWLQTSVFYQIFPDRFANGDTANDPRGELIPGTDRKRETFAWAEPHAYTPSLIPFWGGDLKGIEDNLDHLSSLGVNAVYLNPVFTGWTNHRYDVINYKEVDPTLGGDEALISLARAMQARGMHYILDIVPNHCGMGHPWYTRSLMEEPGEEKGYFYINPQSGKYSTWMGFSSLLKLNYQSLKLRDEMYAGENAVMKYWLRPPFNADGWRVDVANMLGRHNDHQIAAEILPQIRQALKAEKPEIYLMGENFFDATSQLQGDAWDGVMNYSGFLDPLLHWLRPVRIGALGWKGDTKAAQRWSTRSLVNSWQERLAVIPYAVALQQFNLLGSHDTRRIRTELGGNDTLVRLAAMAQFAFPGIPCIYYGDEIGLVNEEGFESRNCMPWDREHWDLDLLAFYRQLVALRKTNPALSHGSFRILHWSEDLLIFQRQLGTQYVLLSANRSERIHLAQTIDLPKGTVGQDLVFHGSFSQGRLTIDQDRLSLPDLPQGAELWINES